MSFKRLSLILLYLITIISILYLIVVGSGYYRLDQTVRPLHPLNDSFKPSGFIGHGIGIIGSLLMIILLLYSARKRLRWMQNWGNIRTWLDYHIWMGITGPLLVIFHTSFKLGGIVAISFWSMIGVALSGVVGRYIYIQIPRSLSGDQLNTNELTDIDNTLIRKLADYDIKADLFQVSMNPTGKSGWRNLWIWFIEDITLSSKLRRSIQKSPDSGRLSEGEIKSALKLMRQRTILHRRIQFLSTAEGLLHHWHVIHKPFAVVMLGIMVIHIIVAVLFGYVWVFKKTM